MIPNEEGDECKRRLYAPSEEKMANALKFVVVRGAKWVISPTRYSTLRLGDIRENLAIWLYFIKHWIIPTTHHTTIVVERIMLLYNIQRVINLGVIIRKARGVQLVH